MEWISVEDRKPENCETGWDYLVRTLEPSEYGGSYVRKTRVISYDFSDECWVCNDIVVTHWMVLPKPPRD